MICPRCQTKLDFIETVYDIGEARKMSFSCSKCDALIYIVDFKDQIFVTKIQPKEDKENNDA